MEYCAVDGGKLAAVQNAKMQEPIALRGVWGFGGALVGWDCMRYLLCACFCVRGLVGAWKSIESWCVGACSGLAMLGRWWGLRKFCKIYAKIANFCATICADRFRSCYLKLCQIVPKSSRAV